ncbi:dockerin type I repeat-containing protein [Desulfatibacillum aliphaticivorans]|uniref:dockerin type I repeat-containing protein n=1 Tax=Desulfatibacillum aliphaticivorans TaxID=218208 RepID=UPI0012F771AE|nr:dockerin type I repeat-containing protein [Desulfatibacillum aliphaticivorans]
MSPHFVSLGDVNDSGAVNLTDAVLALQALAGMETAGEVCDAADFNGDGMIGLAEVMYIFQVIRASK